MEKVRGVSPCMGTRPVSESFIHPQLEGRTPSSVRGRAPTSGTEEARDVSNSCIGGGSRKVLLL